MLQLGLNSTKQSDVAHNRKTQLKHLGDVGLTNPPEVRSSEGQSARVSEKKDSPKVVPMLLVSGTGDNGPPANMDDGEAWRCPVRECMV